MHRLSQFSAFLLTSCALSVLTAADGNRLTYLDHPCDPYYVGRGFPKLTTPQWIGEEGVEAVVVLAIDDMRDTTKYESYLRPILDRLKRIDGRAPVSIMTCSVDPADEQLQRWLEEGLSIEVHTVDHPCPLLQGGDFAKARGTYDRCVDLMASIRGNQPVAFRMPCCDSRNTPSPRFWTEIFNQKTAAGNFLQADSSVFNITTHHDPDLPRELTIDPDGRERFRKYLPFPSFVNTIEDYPYPYVIGGLCWEFPCVVPSDWEAQNLHQPNNPRTVQDMQAALDAAVLKQGTFNLVFHPHGWIRSEQIVQLIDHAVEKHGPKVKFLTFREAVERINHHLLAGQPLRTADGADNGVRLLDVNADGYIDVVIGNQASRVTRIWQPADQRWQTCETPGRIVEPSEAGRQISTARFGVLRPDGPTSMVVVDGEQLTTCNFDGTRWTSGEAIKLPIPDQKATGLTGIVLRDVDGDGRCELICGRRGFSKVFAREATGKLTELSFGLPAGTSLVDGQGRDAGLRFVDINRDGCDDVIFSNGDRFSVHLFTSRDAGWSQTVMVGERSDPSTGPTIPPIVRTDGTNNGAWVHSGHLWFQNEQTSQLPDGVDRISLELLVPAGP